ncbi:hypothetical protein LQZ18_12520 [Lachnospiraceae bacterium ZAX-1]
MSNGSNSFCKRFWNPPETRWIKSKKLSFNTVSSAVKKLCDEGILVQNKTEQRSRIFNYTDYLDLLREGT